QFEQRISRRVRLEPLNLDELQQYIHHRLEVGRSVPRSGMPSVEALKRAVAEWDGVIKPDSTFSSDAVQAIWMRSSGVPRVVNLLCDRALEAAYSRGLHTVDGSLIEI